MDKILYTFIAILLLASKADGQALVITDSATTPSLCFNTGTIAVAASGGTGPYTFTITGGPSYPNITYPIGLPPLTDTFFTMPKGEYTIKVVDAAGNVSYATATVAGDYEFPILTPIIDGSYCIEVTEEYGKPPYEYAISTTSANAGFGSYQASPIFCVCTGHYWIRVLDSCSNIFTTTQVSVTIPDPAISLTASTRAAFDTIYTDVFTNSAPPYSYHLKDGNISITNTTGVFVVPKSCHPDTVTLTDRCGTTAVAIISPHPLSVSGISDCTTGDAVLTIDSAALGPFVITGSGITGSLNTHNYVIDLTGLPIGSPYSFVITDSCGNVDDVTLPCSTIDTTFFYDVCPFDSSLHLKKNNINYCFPLIATCLSCLPVQIDTVYSVPAAVFTNIDTGVLYTVNLKDACGFNYTTSYATHYAPLDIYDSILTCSDFEMISDPRIFTPPIHYVVYDGGSYYDSIVANDPFFFHVPAGSYTVTATQKLCLTTSIGLSLPNFGGRCVVPMFDSVCTPSYAIFQLYMPSVEVFSLVNPITNQTYIESEPRGTSPALLFADVPVGNYNLVSDSGCSVPYQLPSFTHTVSVVTVTECTGQARITATAVPAITSCNTSQGQYFQLLKDNQYLQSNITGVFIVSDTGYYVVRLFLSNTAIFNFPATYDTICPLDTALFYVVINPIPNVISQQQLVCGHDSANIPYTIFGGTPPYTVSILGYPTRIVTATVDTFPGVFPGLYTMIVSDSCGISRSFSVSVVDTCSPACTEVGQFTLSESMACMSGTVTLTNQSTGATHYEWLVNGAVYAYVTDTTFTATAPGAYTITLYSFVGTCKDTSVHTFTVTDSLPKPSIGDTALCPPINLTLNTHVAQTEWSTSATDSVITITAAGQYWVQDSNSCGVSRDSFFVTERQVSAFDLTSPTGTICDDQPDSAIITAALTDSTGAKVVFIWSTGYYDSLAYSSQIIVREAGSYTVVVDDSFCSQSRSISVDTVSCDSICLSAIAIPDIFTPNGDGKNDTFHILHICPVQPFLLHIYNRWGEKVFESTDIDQGWDGNYRGKPQPEGTFWYWVSLSIDNGKPQYRAGTLTLVR
jgi:gliding motility-associated-like protein